MCLTIVIDIQLLFNKVVPWHLPKKREKTGKKQIHEIKKC